jgi:hypothetical protein
MIPRVILEAYINYNSLVKSSMGPTRICDFETVCSLAKKALGHLESRL